MHWNQQPVGNAPFWISEFQTGYFNAFHDEPMTIVVRQFLVVITPLQFAAKKKQCERCENEKKKEQNKSD